MKPSICIDTDFNRFTNTLKGKKCDRIPQFDFNIHPTIKESVLGRPLNCAKDEIDFWSLAGYDYVQIRLDRKKTEGDSSKTRALNNGSLKNIDQLRNERFRWSDSYDGSWNLNEYNYNELLELAEHMPDKMKFVIHGADIFTRSWIAMGFENFCYAIYEDPEMLTELLMQNYLSEQHRFDLLFEKLGDKIGAVLYSDDIAYTEGLMMNGDVYRQYLFPLMNKLLSYARSLGLPIIYHTDGRLWDVFNDFYKLGINGIQPLEPKSMNLEQLKEKEGKRFCLIGSIDIDVLSRGTSEEVDAMVRERIDILGHDGIYMVGTSNTVPSYVNPQNYVAMIEACRKYGKC